MYTYIDFGAMYLFISTTCLASIGLICENNDSMLEVCIPSGRTMDMNKVAKAILMDFNGLVLKVDLHVIEMKDYDVILGIVWLGSNRPTINCLEKVVLRRPCEIVRRNLGFMGLRLKQFPASFKPCKLRNLKE